MSDFDDLFNFDDDAAPEEEKKETRADPELVPESKKEPVADDLLSDFGFDEDPPSTEVKSEESLDLEPAHTSPPASTANSKPASTDDSDEDLFADFLNDSPSESSPSNPGPARPSPTGSQASEKDHPRTSHPHP